MLTKSWRRKPGLVLAVPTILVSLSGLAQAQQSGLFPLHPIKRETGPVPQRGSGLQTLSIPVLRISPTVWRRFPEGWGCAQPRGPQRQGRVREAARRSPPKPIPPEEGEDQDMQAPPERGRQAIPNPPPDTERSPVRDGQAGQRRGRRANPPARRAPGSRQRARPGNGAVAVRHPRDEPGRAWCHAPRRRPQPKPAPCRACPIRARSRLEAAPPGNAPVHRLDFVEPARSEPDADPRTAPGHARCDPAAVEEARAVIRRGWRRRPRPVASNSAAADPARPRRPTQPARRGEVD